MIGEREGAWLVCHWVGGGTRRKGGRPAEFTSEIANMNTNEIFNCVQKQNEPLLFSELREWLFGPFRPVVRTSSFHVEDTGSIPVRDRYSFPAAFSQCSLLSDRPLSGLKGWSGSFLSPSKQDEITASLSNGLPLIIPQPQMSFHRFSNLRQTESPCMRSFSPPPGHQSLLLFYSR